MKLPLPQFQHPTQVVLVDDSASFVAGLAFQMPVQRPVKSFTSSIDALRWVAAATARVGCQPGTLAATRRLLPHDTRRFSTAAVVVVDYAMPDMDGLAFCRALGDAPCKKILFTGEADERVAVEAFNRGLIDRYHKKSDPDAFDVLLRDIAALEEAYFAERTAAFLPCRASEGLHFLAEPAVAKLVQALRRSHGFVEYYACGDPNGLLLLDAAGNGRLLVLESEGGMDSHVEAAEAYGAPRALVKSLRAREVVPLFWQSGGMYTDALPDWRSACRPAQRVDGAPHWHWALFNLPDGWLPGTVASLEDYLAAAPHGAGSMAMM